MKNDIPLEDCWYDVIRKARCGLAISEGQLSRRSGLSLEDIIALEGGRLDIEQLCAVARVLGLEQKSLRALACGEYHPGFLHLPDGLAMFSTCWDDFVVHSYLLWDPMVSKDLQAAAFDTGSDASELLDFVKSHSLHLEQIFLTHGHGDHVFDLDRLIQKSDSVAWIGEREEISGTKPFAAGQEFSVGGLRIQTRSTWGHSRGGITYVIHGLARPVAIVGDALFAGSMGGAMISYEACLESNKRELFTLPPETLLCPGHGPLTTVALEKDNNPFFA